jgi:hypothetical protein
LPVSTDSRGDVAVPNQDGCAPHLLRFSESHGHLSQQTPSKLPWKPGSEILQGPYYPLRHYPQKEFGFHVTACEWIREERESFHLKPRPDSERFDLLGMQEKNMTIGVRPKLEMFVDRRVRTFAKLRKVIANVGAVRRCHNNVTAGTDKPCDASEKFIRVRHVLDDLGDEDSVEKRRESYFKCIARSEAEIPAFVFQPDVIGQLFAQIIPGDLVSHLRQREGKISLRRREIENARARRQNLSHEAERFAAPAFIGVSIAAIFDQPVNFLQIVSVRTLPGRRPIFLE